MDAKTPTFNCPIPMSTYGGTYQLSIAAITADEVAYAGSVFFNINRTHYLYNDTNFWTMSPYNTYSGSAREFYVLSTGDMAGYNVDYSQCGYRPVIELNPNTYVTGQGTIDKPWAVQ